MGTPRKPLWPKIVVTVVVAWGLYVASIGPMAALGTRGMLSERIVDAGFEVYRPLRWFCECSPLPARDALYWYQSLWTPDAGWSVEPI